jgi:cell wall-associated NlpC family hydrolase
LLGNARLRAYLAAVTVAAFLISAGPNVPAVAAATPTAPSTTDLVTQVAPTPTPTAPAVSGTVAPAPLPSVTAPLPAVRATATTRPTPTWAQEVIAIAKSKLGRPWVYGADGPSVFDCSGLVVYAFRMAGIARIVGSSHEVSAFALYARFRALGLASRSGGKPGDLIIWGGGSHVGIYLGNGMAISTLVGGVRIHGVWALTTPFTAFLHTGIASLPATVAPRPTTAVSAATRAAIVTGRRATTTALRLRSTPSTAARVIATLASGTKVGVVRTAKDRAGRTWYRVLVGGRLGWLAGWYTRSAS